MYIYIYIIYTSLTEVVVVHCFQGFSRSAVFVRSAPRSCSAQLRGINWIQDRGIP